MPATAKKKTAKKSAASKKKVSKKVDSFLSVKSSATAPKKKSSKKEKPVRHFPADDKVDGEYSLAEMMDMCVGATRLGKALDRKVKDFSNTLREHMLAEYVVNWANEKKKPPTETWRGLRGSSLDLIVQAFAPFTHDKVKAIQDEVGIELDDNHYEICSFKVDLKELEKNQKYYDAFKDFLSKIDPEDLENNKIFERNFKFKKDFLERLGQFVNFDQGKLKTLFEILQLKVQFRNQTSTDSEEYLFDAMKQLQG